MKRVNDAARRAGVIDSVAQFENLSTHAQYRLPYFITAKTLKPGDRVLDWGCGNGHFSLFLESLGMRVTGYSFEPPPRCMAASETFRFVPGSEADPRTLPFEDASFDAAVSCGVLEHVWETGGDERASLNELARVVKPGGTLLVYHLPNHTGWVEQVVRGLKLNKYVHGRRFSEPQIRELWGDAGFRVTDIGRYNALPRAEMKKMPSFLRERASFAKFYDTVDAAAAAVLPRVCTNYFVVARSGAPATS
ncbi:MAG TPA: class I SAM-dependent methyltransferase [Gemmatimonadaceae bacterium]